MSNFVQFDSAGTNMEADPAFAADSFITGGAASGGQCPSSAFNRLLYQLSVGVDALMTMMTTKGFTVTDGYTSPSTAVANLASVLANIRTTTVADLQVINQLNVTTSGVVPSGSAWRCENAVGGGTVTRTLYSAVGFGGFLYTMKNTTGSPQIIQAHAGEFIDGLASVSVNFSTTIMSNGTGWLVLFQY